MQQNKYTIGNVQINADKVDYFPPIAGSHMLPGYYSMRRPFISDSEFCSSTKQLYSDVYQSTLGTKALSSEPPSMSSYSSLIDSYYPESFSDYRSTPSLSASGSSFPQSSTLSSLLPSFSGEAPQLILVRQWIGTTTSSTTTATTKTSHERT